MAKRKTPKVDLGKKITKEESKIDWNMTAQEIHNKIMAFNSWPIAETTLSGERIRIYDSKYNENDIIGIPGNIKSYENNIEVFTKKGTLSILSLQKECINILDSIITIIMTIIKKIFF